MSCHRSLPLLTSAAPCSLLGAGEEPPVQCWERMRSRAVLRWNMAAVQGFFFGMLLCPPQGLWKYGFSCRAESCPQPACNKELL